MGTRPVVMLKIVLSWCLWVNMCSCRPPVRWLVWRGWWRGVLLLPGDGSWGTRRGWQKDILPRGQDLQGTWPRSASNVAKVCKVRGQGLQAMWPRSARYVARVCKQCGQGLQCMWPRSARDVANVTRYVAKVCNVCGQGLQGTWPRSASNVAKVCNVCGHVLQGKWLMSTRYMGTAWLLQQGVEDWECSHKTKGH